MEVDFIKFFKALYIVILCFIPSFLSVLIEFGLFLANVIFSGLIGDAEFISGCGLGIMTNNIVVSCVGVGL